MDKEYIERESALDCFACDLGKKDYSVSYQGFMTEAAFRINAVPAADVVPVRHGHWLEKTDRYCGFETTDVKCSVCHKISEFGKFAYCPECGAKMDGDI